jgi:neutral ceramidase
MSNLTAGFAQSDITPPIGIGMAGYGARTKPSERVQDPLIAQALVLTAGDQTAAIVCLDNIGLNWDIVAAARQRAEALSGIPEGNIVIAATHSHWGPMTSGGEYMPQYMRDLISPEYNAKLIDTLAQIVAEANSNRVAAVAGVGSGFADLVTFNRRVSAPDFSTQWLAAMEPPLALVASREGNRLARKWRKGEHKGPRLSQPLAEFGGSRVGPADGEVGLLRIEKSDGTPLAGLMSFACHAVCGAGEDSFYAISADWTGEARAAFQSLLGIPLMYASGCSGDQVPRWRRDDSRQRVGKSVGAEAAHVWWGIDECHGDLPLAVTRRTVNLPPNTRVPSLAQAQANLAAMPDPEGPEALWQRCAVMLAKEIEAGIPAEIWAMRIGELGIVGVPGETLTEIGLQIKQRSPFKHTMTVSLANGCIGYLPTDDAIHAGGYEPEWSPVGFGTERMLVETGLELLEELAK